MPPTNYVPDPRAANTPPSREYDCDCTTDLVFPVGAIHHWDLDEAAGQVRVDDIGGLNFAEVGGNVPAVAGKHSNAAEVEPTFLQTSVDWTLTGDFSIACWFKFPSTLGDSWSILSKDETGTSFAFRMDDVDKPNFTIGTGPPFGAIWPTAVAAGSYHLLVGVYDDGAVRLSVDGGNFVTGSAGTTGNPISKLFLRDASSAFQHDIDELTIWNRAITFAEVLNLWNNGAGLFP